ncbi:Zinc finger RING/FYVE/PHD-type protein [Dioscorea alata]|uniref:Zinc finger RING/FYVE/PHD-type protein n=1 Tax=Dioscorea alata TaxID=55571 RepID=A0ACB7URV7_DIOAL|nr:Zinc finger RING/FYVE/PHD-type protein [Dioscorea alata]
MSINQNSNHQREEAVKMAVPTNLPQCTICQQSLDILISDVKAICICGHFFHSFCLHEWMEKFLLVSQKPACPICKQRFSSAQLFRLFPSMPNPGIGSSLALVPSLVMERSILVDQTPINQYEKKERKSCRRCKRLIMFTSEFAKLGSRAQKSFDKNVGKILKMKSLLDPMLELVRNYQEEK